MRRFIPAIRQNGQTVQTTDLHPKHITPGSQRIVSHGPKSQPYLQVPASPMIPSKPPSTSDSGPNEPPINALPDEDRNHITLPTQPDAPTGISNTSPPLLPTNPSQGITAPSDTLRRSTRQRKRPTYLSDYEQ